jgi:hypothetical protein
MNPKKPFPSAPSPSAAVLRADAYTDARVVLSVATRLANTPPEVLGSAANLIRDNIASARAALATVQAVVGEPPGGVG